MAAGSGSRFGADRPKQFCDLGGRPVLMTTIERLRRCGGDIVLVLSPDWTGKWSEMCSLHSFTSPRVVAGGATRWESVRRGLEAVSPDTEIITVHDGARPVVEPDLVRRLVGAVTSGADGAIPVTPMTDSLRRVNSDGSSCAVDRAPLRAVQTPQVFAADRLRRAYTLPYRPDFTDDASVVEAAGFTRLALVEGSPRNIKITRPGDIEIASLYLAATDAL